VACLSACARPVAPVQAPRPPAPELQAALSLLGSAVAPTQAATRCLVVLPGRLDPAHAGEVAVVSQSDGSPWRLPGVLAYVRLEHGEERQELYRFASPPAPAQVHAQLRRDEEVCFGQPGCFAQRSDWLDPHTLRIRRGQGEAPGIDCAAALRAHPRALEVAVRAQPGGELRQTEVVLEQRSQGVERLTTRSYGAPEAARRAWHAALRGQEELPSLAGVAAQDLGVVQGAQWLQRTAVEFADLQLALEERARVQRAAPLNPSDRGAVYASFDSRVGDPRERAALEVLLSVARTKAPDDDGLLRRHHQLMLLRSDAQAAYALASDALARNIGDPHAWQLRARSALARFDEAALARSLRAEYSLGASVAARMARELSEKAHADPTSEQERAEWAFLVAARLASQPVGARAPLALRVPVLELPRLLATFAQAARPEQGLMVNLLAFGPARTPPAARVEPTAGAGRPGVLMSASDDAQLVALGAALATQLEEGPFELRIELERSDASAHVTLLLVGQRAGGWLELDHGSRALRAVQAEPVERLLASPLRKLTGNAFPPDELVIEARSEAEASAAEQGAAKLTCRRDGLTVRCRGSLSDAGAAHRALLTLAHQLLPDARALWSGTD
jgi:hypothetical protein